MKLRSHLLVLIAATLLPMLAFAAVASWVFVRYESATFKRGATERTLALLTAIDAELRGHVTTLQALAVSTTLDEKDLRTFHAEATRVLQSQSGWLTVNLARPSGQQVVNTARPFGAPLPSLLGLPSFHRLPAPEQPLISDLIVTVLTKEPAFAVRVPVVLDGTTAYVLSATVSTRAIAELLAAQRLPADWVGVVLDGNHRIVARTVDPQRTVGQPASESLRAALARAPEGWFEGSTIEGARVYTPYNRSSFSGWTIAMGIPAAAVETATWRTAGALAVGALIATVSALLLALALSRRITRPVARLAGAARALGRGERPDIPASTAVEEVGELARALHEASAAVRAREETQGRLAAIVEASSDAILSYSPDGIIQTWNPAATRLFGHAAEDAVGRHMSMLVPPERAGEVPEIFAAVLAGQPRALETQRLRKDGWRVDVAVHVSPIRGVGGEVTGLMAAIRDISERKEAQARLAASEARLRASEEGLRLALAGARQGTWAWDLRTRALAWDERCKAIFGLSADFPVTYDWHVAALHPDDRGRVVQAADVSIREQTDFDEEYRVFRPDGSVHWVLARGRAYYEGGEAVRMAGTVLDITERKRAEEALRAADRAKDEFLAMLGHELRNPLGAIAGAVGVLGQVEPLDEKADRARAVIVRQVTHLSRLVDDLLDVSRITSAKVMLSPRPLDLGALVAGVLSAWRTSGRLDSHQVSVDTASVWIDGDEARIEQVVANLVGNALKYTPPGGRVAIRVAPDGEVAVLQVEDTGMGIPVELIERVFDAFVQGERALDRSQGGLGLGLSVVKALVEKHGGSVHASSAGPGKGALFTVRLPRVSPAPSRVTLASPGTARPCRVLVIEDNEDTREMVSVVLQLAGHEVQVAPDGPRGLELAAATIPDVALIDVGLPGMDGYEVARRIRAGADGHRTRLVAVTGYGQAEDRRRAGAAGFDTHLTKPVVPERLLEVVAGADAERVRGPRP